MHIISFLSLSLSLFSLCFSSIKNESWIQKNWLILFLTNNSEIEKSETTSWRDLNSMEIFFAAELIWMHSKCCPCFLGFLRSFLFGILGTLGTIRHLTSSNNKELYFHLSLSLGLRYSGNGKSSFFKLSACLLQFSLYFGQLQVIYYCVIIIFFSSKYLFRHFHSIPYTIHLHLIFFYWQKWAKTELIGPWLFKCQNTNTGHSFLGMSLPLILRNHCGRLCFWFVINASSCHQPQSRFFSIRFWQWR